MLDLALDGRVFIQNELDEAVQELDLLFNTDLTELIGYPKYGTNFETFSWQVTPEENRLRDYIYSLINNTLYLSKFRTDVEVTSEFGEYRYIYVVKIHVYDDNNNKEVVRNYEFR